MIACPNCRTIQSADTVNTGRMATCQACQVLLRIDVFNAFLRRDEPEAAVQSAHAHGQAECFYHPGKLAVAPCASCGRLLCAVCQVELDGRNLCMGCLQAGRDKQKITALQHRHVRYDEIALNLAFWPVLTIFLTLLTAPAAIYFAVRHWRTPSPVLPKGRFKSILAVVLAVVQIAGWIVVLVRQLGA